MINDCDENDNGAYTITVDDTKSSTAEVIVEPEQEKIRSPSPKVDAQKEEPKVEVQKEEPKVEAQKEEPKVEAPKEEPKSPFRKLLPKELKTNEDNDFVLECEVNNPKQITDWYLDDDLIEPNTPRFEVINNGESRKLKGLI